MMTDRAPTDNNELRLAIKHLQNRERVLKLIYKGNGMLGNDHAHARGSFDLPNRFRITTRA